MVTLSIWYLTDRGCRHFLGCDAVSCISPVGDKHCNERRHHTKACLVQHYGGEEDSRMVWYRRSFEGVWVWASEKC